MWSIHSCLYVIFIVIFDALKDKEKGIITFQELANFFRLLLPSSLPQANLDTIVTSLLHQVSCNSEDVTSSSSSSQHNEVSLEDFTKVMVMFIKYMWSIV